MSSLASPSHLLREDVDALLERLARIDAERAEVRVLADDLRGAAPVLVSSLATLERDLTLAARAASRLQDRIA